MALKAALTAEQFVALDAATKAHYQQSGDMYLLAVEPVNGYQLRDVDDLTKALARERGELKTARERLADFEGLDAKAARDAVSKVGAMKDWKPEDKVREQIEAIKADLVGKHGTERAGLETQVKELQAQLEEHLVVASATKAITEQKGNVELLLPHVRSQVRVTKDAKGKFFAEVVDHDGNPRISLKSKAAENMGIGELVESMRNSPTYAPAFAGSGQSGTGSAAIGKTQGPAFTLTVDEAHDPRIYQARKAEADKAGRPLQIAG